ncbi:hypothetical protein TEQG_01886 [Trichophyton equinum CBS 127.97]|uniref:Uncharacterized protein n=1 Tax=Trichophyton equinum (strain ATCC MYA-4606 / CBS 127.97) TaxID=559882 RepID=F2PLT0_TRIEC|nr:hypothetical protein TEQG_01886 [Trichophyton equinum CBS 127.97]
MSGDIPKSSAAKKEKKFVRVERFIYTPGYIIRGSTEALLESTSYSDHGSLNNSARSFQQRHSTQSGQNKEGSLGTRCMTCLDVKLEAPTPVISGKRKLLQHQTTYFSPSFDGVSHCGRSPNNGSMLVAETSSLLDIRLYKQYRKKAPIYDDDIYSIHGVMRDGVGWVLHVVGRAANRSIWSIASHRQTPGFRSSYSVRALDIHNATNQNDFRKADSALHILNYSQTNKHGRDLSVGCLR